MSNSLNWTKDRDLVHEFILAGKRAFVQGRQDGAFHGKWDGIWDMPIKLADYVRLAIWSPEAGVEWLDSCKEFTVSLGYIDHVFETKQHGLEIVRRTFVPEDEEGAVFIVQFVNKSSEKKFFHLFAELYADLRPRERDDNPSNYLVEFNAENRAIITCSADKKWFVIFGLDRKPDNHYLGDFHDDLLADGTLTGKGAGKTSNTAGRSCFECHIELNPAESQKLTFVIAGNSISEEEALASFKHIMSEVDVLFSKKLERYLHVATETVTIDTPDKSLDKAFIWAKLNLEMLKHNQPGIGRGFFAGYPWFTMYWGRDSGWLLQAVDNYGDFDAVDEALSTLVKYQSKSNGERYGYKIRSGEIPNEIRTDGTVVYYSADATPLFIIASLNHLKWTGDREFLEKIYPAIIRAVEWGFSSDENKDNLIEHYGDGSSGATWMDTYYRVKAAVEVETLWSKALESAAEMAEIRNDMENANRWKNTAEDIRKKINELYWNEDKKFLYDIILPDGKPDVSLTINPIIPVIYGFVDQEKASVILNHVEQDFTTPWGVRTRSKVDPEYNGSSYHKGNVWGLTTGWTAWAEFSQDQPERGLSYLKTLADLMKIRCLGAIPEVLNGDNPISSGCALQAWSSSVLIQGVVEYLFGIKPNAVKHSVLIDTCLPEQWNEAKIRNLLIGNMKMNASFQVKGNAHTLTVVGDKEYKVVAGFRLPKNAEITNIVIDKVELPLNRPNINIVKKQNSLRVYIETNIKPNQEAILEVLFKGEASSDPRKQG